MKKLYFSVLSYSPSFISNELINVGIIFEYEGEYRFEHINNYKRLIAFDDELNIDIVKLFFQGIRDEISYSVYNINKTICLKNYVSYFVNEFKFSNIQLINCDSENYESSIEEIKKMYLRFEYERDKRPNQEDQINFYSKLLKSNDIKYSRKKLEGGYEGTTVKYDFIINNLGIKFFIFKGKDLNKVVDTARTWAFKAEEMKEKLNMDTIFIYDNEELDQPSFKGIVDILDKNGEVLTFEKGVEFMDRFKKLQSNTIV